MTRAAVFAALSVAALACATAPSSSVAGDTSTPTNTSLLGCLEPIARTFHVRIVDSTGRVESIACAPLDRHATLEQALDRLLQPNGLEWRRLDDGTLEVIVAKSAPASVKLPALDIE